MQETNQHIEDAVVVEDTATQEQVEQATQEDEQGGVTIADEKVTLKDGRTATLLVDPFPSIEEYVKFIGQPISCANIPMTIDDNEFSVVSAIVSESGAFGGFVVNSVPLPSHEEAAIFAQKVAKGEVERVEATDNEPGFVTVVVEGKEDGVSTTYRAAEVAPMAVLNVDRPRFDFEKSTWMVDVEPVIELGDFLSPNHVIMTFESGKGSVSFPDEITATNFYQDVKAHYEANMKFVLDTFIPKELQADSFYNVENRKEVKEEEVKEEQPETMSGDYASPE